MLIALLLTAAAAQTELEPPEVPDADPALVEYLLEAADNHPALAQRHEEWLAALEVIPQVTSLDDPMFRYSQYIQSPMARAEFEVMQKFPWFGTLAARGDAAAADAEAALQRFFAERDAIFYGVRRWYREYQWLADQIRVVEAQQTIVDYVADLVESKMSLGLATDVEWLRINISRTQLQDRLDGLHEEIPAVSAALAAAIGRSGEEVLPLPEASGLPPEPPALETVRARIDSANPSLRVADHRIESLRHQEEVARKRGRPEFTVGLEYMLNRRPQRMGPSPPNAGTLGAVNRLGRTVTGEVAPMPIDILMDLEMINTARRASGRSDRPRDGVMVNITMTLPIYRDRVRASINETRARQRAVQHEREAQRLGLEAAAAEAIFRMRDGSRRYAVHETSLLPQAEMTVESTADKYAADAFGVSFIDMLDTTNQLLDFELEKARALRDWRLGEAELLLLTSGELLDFFEDEAPVARPERMPILDGDPPPIIEIDEGEVPEVEAHEAQ